MMNKILKMKLLLGNSSHLTLPQNLLNSLMMKHCHVIFATKNSSTNLTWKTTRTYFTKSYHLVLAFWMIRSKILSTILKQFTFLQIIFKMFLMLLIFSMVLKMRFGTIVPLIIFCWMYHPTLKFMILNQYLCLLRRRKSCPQKDHEDLVSVRTKRMLKG